MNLAIAAHKTLLKSQKSEGEETIKEFVERFEKNNNNPLLVNSFSYVLNLHTLKYEYISESCVNFSGKTAQEHLKKGLDILPVIMEPNDLNKLSNEVFPEMKNTYDHVASDRQKSVLFELYYRLKNTDGESLIQMVEYSSYAHYDEEGNPTISTGICFESPLQINGVRGIVRCNSHKGHETLYDKMILHDLELLTNTELRLAELLAKGQSKKAIATEMNISIHTVKTHFKNIYKKLDINRASELISYMNSN